MTSKVAAPLIRNPFDGKKENSFAGVLEPRAVKVLEAGDAAIAVPGCQGTGNGRTRRDATPVGDDPAPQSTP